MTLDTSASLEHPSLTPPPPRGLSVKQALFALFGRTQPSLTLHPLRVSPLAAEPWLLNAGERSWSKLPARHRAAFLREVCELEEVFHTSAFLRSGAIHTRYLKALGLIPYAPEVQMISPQVSASLLKELHQEFQTFQAINPEILSPNQQLSQAFSSDSPFSSL